MIGVNVKISIIKDDGRRPSMFEASTSIGSEAFHARAADENVALRNLADIIQKTTGIEALLIVEETPGLARAV